MYWNVPTSVPCAVSAGGVIDTGLWTCAAEDGCGGFSQAEVEQLRAGLRQHDVPRLHVAMHDAQPMRRIERSHDLVGIGQCLRERNRAALEARGQGLAFQVFHDEEGDAVLVADIVDRTDVRMDESSDRLRLAVEACPKLRIASEGRRQNFHRNCPMEARVGRQIHLSHAPGSKRALDTVGTDVATRLKDRIGFEHGSGEVRH